MLKNQLKSQNLSLPKQIEDKENQSVNSKGDGWCLVVSVKDLKQQLDDEMDFISFAQKVSSKTEVIPK